MNVFKRTIGALALVTVAAVGYGEDTVIADGAEREVSGTGAIVQCALDLSEVWDKRNGNDEPILWSSLGWDAVPEAENGKSVTLHLVPLSAGAPQTLASGLKGHLVTHDWILGDVLPQVYNIKHVIVGGSSFEKNLNAYFSFENYDPESDMAVRMAIAAQEGGAYEMENDLDNSWEPVGGPGEGIMAPQGGSAFTFTVDGRGTFFFDYILAGGTWTVKVDGAVVRTMDAAADWTGEELPVAGAFATHVIEFVTELSGGDLAKLRNVRWIETEGRFGGGRSGGGAVDLREGVLTARRPDELMPFAWSSTNFTGNALVKNTGFVTIDPQSVVSVRVVQVTGEGEDVSRWTTEVADTEKTLVSEKQGEGAIRWRGVQQGVWKAELVIKTNGSETYRETRILDLRKYSGQGLVFFVM